MATKILLVYPPNQLMEEETPRPDGSLGPLYLAGACEDAGFQVDILDTSVGPAHSNLANTFYRTVMQENGLIRIGMTETEISDVIAKGGYHIVGINSNFTPQTKMAFEVARAAKAVSRDILVIAGGVNARALAERFLQRGVVDAVCLTEGERIIVNLLRALEKGGDISTVSGIARLRSGEIVRQSVAPLDICQNLDELPLPRWEKLPFAHYDRITSPHAVLSQGSERYAPIMTSRGCWAKCLYCHISREKDHASETGNIGTLRFKSVDRVMQEAHQLQDLGIRKLYFEDDTLLAKKARIHDIFTRIRGMGFQIADVNGVNLVHFLKREDGRLVIDREYLELLKDAGFDQIVFPVESASQRIVDKYATGKLNHQKLDVVALVRIARGIGITCPINMMIGFPDETEDEIYSSIELGKRLVEAGAGYCTFFIPIPFPGSELYALAIKDGHLQSDFNTDMMNWKKPIMTNTTVPPERILELRDWGFEYANTNEHVRMRLEASAGHRWQSGAAVSA